MGVYVTVLYCGKFVYVFLFFVFSPIVTKFLVVPCRDKVFFVDLIFLGYVKVMVLLNVYQLHRYGS